MSIPLAALMLSPVLKLYGAGLEVVSSFCYLYGAFSLSFA